MHRASILISLGLALTACTASDGDEGIFISKNVFPGDNCTFSASESEHFLTHGTMSLAGGTYKIYPQMVSKITANETNVQQRTIQVKGARVDIELTDSDVSVDSSVLHFESRFAAPIAPNGGITDAEFVGLSKEFLGAMRDKYGNTAGFETEVIINAVVYGDLAGSEVTSQKFQFPVTVCTNCVLNTVGMCPLPPGSVVTSAPSTCSAFQDGYTECCTVPVTGELQCPATIALPPVQRALSVTLAGIGTIAGTGSVASAPAGITCGGDCSQSYDDGTTVTLTATPTLGRFTGWSGNCVNTTGTCVLLMDDAKNVTATFTNP